MPLSCSCDFDPYDDGAWFFDAPDDYQPLDRHRAVRCASCTALIKPGDTTIQSQSQANAATLASAEAP